MQAFLDALVDAPAAYLLALLVSAGGIAWVARSSVTSLYDPWALQLFQSAFASAAVIFMWWAGVIKPSLGAYHVVALLAFLLFAGASFRQGTRKQCVDRRVRRGPLGLLRTMLLVTFVSTQFAAWALGGVPILLDSRLDAFASGGGIGVLSRIISFSAFAVVFLTVLRIGTSPRRRLEATDVFVFTFSVLASVANASKSNIVLTLLQVLVSHWIFRRLFRDYAAPHVSRPRLIILCLGVGALVLVPLIFELARDPASTIGGPLEAVAIRLVLSGDGYMWLYGDDYLSSVIVESPIALLLSDLLGVTRLVPWDQLPVHPGLQIYRDLFPLSDAVKGPNVRVDAFGLLFGGMVVGAAFSAVLGALFGLLRALPFRVKRTEVFLPAIYLFFQAPALLVDPLLGVTALVNAGFAAVMMTLMVGLIGRDPLGTGSPRTRGAENRNAGTTGSSCATQC